MQENSSSRPTGPKPAIQAQRPLLTAGTHFPQVYQPGVAAIAAKSLRGAVQGMQSSRVSKPSNPPALGVKSERRQTAIQQSTHAGIPSFNKLQRVIQRKIGFEFETVNLVEWKVFGPSAAFNEKTVLLSGNGWKAVADIWKPPMGLQLQYWASEYGEENIVSRGELEFVTEAFEEDANGMVQLERALSEISAAVKWIKKGAQKNTKIGGFTLPLKNNIRIYIDAEDPVAKPQMSAGIRLDQVPTALAAVSGKESLDEAGLLKVAQLKTLDSEMQKILTVAKERSKSIRLDPESQRAYEGAIAHLAAYLLWARVFVKSGLPKARVPFLSRTNLGELKSILSLGENFKLDVLACVPGINATDVFLPNYNVSNWTVGQWLDEVAAGRGHMDDWSQSNLPEWQPQLVGSSGNRQFGHVYEFRGFPDGLPLDKWAPFAREHFKIICQINAQKHPETATRRTFIAPLPVTPAMRELEDPSWNL